MGFQHRKHFLDVLGVVLYVIVSQESFPFLTDIFVHFSRLFHFLNTLSHLLDLLSYFVFFFLLDPQVLVNFRAQGVVGLLEVVTF